MPTIRSERFTISIRIDGNVYKVFKIIFHTGKLSNTTSIIVNFPYFKESHGILSKLTHPANHNEPIDLSLIPEGKVTSHFVKYSHPIDGNAHFSGDGKIITSISNKSKRLDSSVGHLFTIQSQGITDFRLKEDKKKFTDKEIDLDFNFPNKITDAFKFVGWWFNPTELKGTIDNSKPLQPHFGFKEADGKIYETGFIISPPLDSPLSNFIMLLSCRSIPLINKTGGSTFSFIGGFDQESIPTEDFHFLACSYPTDNYDMLLQKIGTADFNLKNPLSK